MGKVTTYCQISGCSPEVEDIVDLEYTSGDLEYGPNVTTAFRLLSSEDEVEGQQALSIIGALDKNDNPLWDAAMSDDYTVEEALDLPEDSVRVLHGCSMGGMFDLGFCEGPGGVGGSLVSFGCCFFVLTNMLPILEAATSGRVSPRRLWNLVISRGHIVAHADRGLRGVNYGPIRAYWHQFPWLFGGLTSEAIASLEEIGTPDDIAEVIRDKGFWMWMRPDRFPIDLSTYTLPSAIAEHPADTTPNTPIMKLPSELSHSIASYLPLSGIIALVRVNRLMYHQLFGNCEARDTLAKVYMRSQARWCLPYGEAERRWWDDRNGDEGLGWDYLKRCWSESYSMRNRRRIWMAAESIEEECIVEEAKRANRVAATQLLHSLGDAPVV